MRCVDRTLDIDQAGLRNTVVRKDRPRPAFAPNLSRRIVGRGQIDFDYFAVFEALDALLATDALDRLVRWLGERLTDFGCETDVADRFHPTGPGNDGVAVGPQALHARIGKLRHVDRQHRHRPDHRRGRARLTDIAFRHGLIAVTRWYLRLDLLGRARLLIDPDLRLRLLGVGRPDGDPQALSPDDFLLGFDSEPPLGPSGLLFGRRLALPRDRFDRPLVAHIPLRSKLLRICPDLISTLRILGKTRQGRCKEDGQHARCEENGNETPIHGVSPCQWMENVSFHEEDA